MSHKINFAIAKSLAMLIFIIIVSINDAISGVMINSTRIIFTEKKNSANVTLTNVTKSDYAVQVWVNGVSDNATEKTPFIAMPALFKLKAGQEQVARIVRTPGVLANDRESVFYFNAQEIPSVKSGENGNSLRLAIRTRIKLFYRPNGLSSRPETAPMELTWSLFKNKNDTYLRVNNPSPYHITFSELNLKMNGKKIDIEEPAMVLPKSTLDYKIPSQQNTTSGTVTFKVINDYGGLSKELSTAISH